MGFDRRFRRGQCSMTSNVQIRILAIVPSGFCFGLQNLTLAFFGALSPRVQAHFLNTHWNDGEFPRRVGDLGISQSFTWLGMFSRKLDRRNLQMTLACVSKLPIAWWHFAKLYRQFRPDVVYFANYHEILLLLPLLIFLRHKVVCHMHDPPPPIFFQRASFSMWRRVVGRFFFISLNVRERTALLGKVKRDDVVVYNGVKIAPLSESRVRSNYFVKRFHWSADTIIVGMTGQMTRNKGHEDFLEAARLSLKIDARLRFVIGGQQVEPYYSELQNQVSMHKMEQFVSFCGWLPSVRDFYEGLDLFVLPSRHEEGFGLVVAEAMERGCVVVATRSGGAAEIVENGKTGFLVDRQSPVQLSEAICLLATSTDLLKSMSFAGRRRVEALFDLAKQARLFESILCASEQ